MRIALFYIKLEFVDWELAFQTIKPTIVLNIV